MKNEIARVAMVPIGHVEVEGLMLPDSSFAIGVSQAAETIERISKDFQFPKKHASRRIKSILGKDSQFPKVKSELNPKAVNVLSLREFKKLTYKLAREDEGIDEFVEVLYELSLHQLFCDAFGVKFEKEDRQQWLEFRAVHKTQFHPMLTSWLKQDGCKEGRDYAREVNRFKLCAKLPLKSVNEYTKEELVRLNQAEVAYNALRKIGISHADALKYI